MTKYFEVYDVAGNPVFTLDDTYPGRFFGFAGRISIIGTGSKLITFEQTLSGSYTPFFLVENYVEPEYGHPARIYTEGYTLKWENIQKTLIVSYGVY